MNMSVLFRRVRPCFVEHHLRLRKFVYSEQRSAASLHTTSRQRLLRKAGDPKPGPSAPVKGVDEEKLRALRDLLRKLSVVMGIIFVVSVGINFTYAAYDEGYREFFSDKNPTFGRVLDVVLKPEKETTQAQTDHNSD